MSQNLVKLNVGGHKYHTTVCTLTKYPDTFFTSLLADRFECFICNVFVEFCFPLNLPSSWRLLFWLSWSKTKHRLNSAKDDEGYYFIDRDGQFFPPILTFLRTDDISINPHVCTREDVLREAKFFLIAPLIDRLEQAEAAELQAENANSQQQSPSSRLQPPAELEKYVADYFGRHETTIMGIIQLLNKKGNLNVSVQIVPGHRQDFERPPQLLENGKLGLFMNFTALYISKYTHVQVLLGKCFAKRGLSGYFRPGEQMELWWNATEIPRKHDIVYFW